MSAGPLHGCRVIELAHIMAGPVAGLMLADMGADVVKVEKPAGDDTRRMVPPEISGADALVAAGVAVDLKCSDGLCGVCRCGVVAGEVEHRDHVLSSKQRETAMILCRSRAAQAEGVIELDL